MDTIIDTQISAPATKPRNAFIAFLLSLVLPGLGQVYNGQIKKGLLFFGVILVLPFIFGITRDATYFKGLLALLGIEVILRIYSIVDSVRHARRLKAYIPKSYNTWYYHLLIAIAMYGAIAAYGNSAAMGIKTFKIPTTSNQPTFQVGDWLVADLRAYEKTKPDYGDIVVFKGNDGQIYTYRVVGLPNDKIELNDDIPTINGKQSAVTFIREGKSEQFQTKEFEEILPNGHKHRMYTFQLSADSNKRNIKDINVPSDRYYVLGDNRDNAMDSRYRGFIAAENIVGRIVYSYWGATTDRINIDFRDK